MGLAETSPARSYTRIIIYILFKAQYGQKIAANLAEQNSPIMAAGTLLRVWKQMSLSPEESLASSGHSDRDFGTVISDTARENKIELSVCICTVIVSLNLKLIPQLDWVGE